uniref:cysteine-S-conjugate beta-lyase n=1 Tax=Loigolactobacillus rennini TaxID=238013 RepID=A0A1K2I4S8_9LACO|nr:Aspartate aminotransferase [Loigolactobacillus rennini]
MKYDFEHTNGTRYGTGSGKWQAIEDTLHSRPQDIVPLSVADMEFKTAPEIVNGVKDALENTVLGYYQPTPAYYKAVGDWMKNRHHWQIKPEWIVNTDGIVRAFHVAVRAYTKPGEGVILMTPVYYPMYHAIQYNQRQLVENPLIDAGDHYEIDWADFEQKCQDPNVTMFLMCSPHNPGSRLWTKAEQEKIFAICQANHVLVVVDEIHNDLVMPGHQHVMFPTISKAAEQNCVVMTAPSKTFNLAGFQTSNIIIPNETLRQQFLAILYQGTPGPNCNYLGYKACYYAYTQGAAWLDQCLQVIQHNYQLVADFMQQNFPQIKVFKLEASYLLWMNWNGLNLDYKELQRINQQEAKLFFDEGAMFGKAAQGFERWNLAEPTHYVEEALQRMKQTYAKYVD